VKASHSAAGLAVAAGLAGAAALVKVKTSRTERGFPPAGRFVEVDGARLHYVEQGDGPPLVLLHGLGSMIEDFRLSGLIDQAAQRYRVIAFDRPGYGHSTRPSGMRWGPAAQARLVRKALQKLNAHRPIVLGHSWGGLVATAFALEYPDAAQSLVLVSGLYFPSFRVDAPVLAPPAIPLFGALLRHTVSPLLGRALWPVWLKLIFAPDAVPSYFSDFPAWMSVRPDTLRAIAEESLYTLPATLRLVPRIPQLTLPVAVVAGVGDRYVSARGHSGRLDAMLPSARLFRSQRSGHMVHHSDLPLVLEAIDMAASERVGLPNRLNPATSAYSA
jgi:pimeloyl-ACP methyl ester carboxylesterase